MKISHITCLFIIYWQALLLARIKRSSNQTYLRHGQGHGKLYFTLEYALEKRIHP